jgi:hypothetical protein
MERDKYEPSFLLAEKLYQERESYYRRMVCYDTLSGVMAMFCMTTFAALWLFEMPVTLYIAMTVITLVAVSTLLTAGYRARKEMKTLELSYLGLVGFLREMNRDGNPMERAMDQARLSRFPIAPS